MDNNYVTFRCPNEWRAELEAKAAAAERSLSAEIRLAIRKHLSEVPVATDMHGRTNPVRHPA